MSDLIERHRDALAAICRCHHVRQLDVFGSVAGERFDPRRSDVDFLVEFDDLELDAYADAYFGLLGDLEALLDLPVDLVMTSAVSNAYFLRAIASSRMPVYADRD